MRLAWLLLAGLLSACADAGPNRPVPIGFAQLPGWNEDATDAAFAQFRRECDRLGMLPPREDLGGGATVADFGSACLAARQVTSSGPADARSFFAHWFTAFDEGPTIFAGYDEPEFGGSLSRGGAYQTPVLARPPELQTIVSAGKLLSGHSVAGRLVPYATRAEIDRGALAGRGLDLVWLRDPVDLFFLQLQGFGRIRLPSGQVVRVGYAGKNGQPYVPLGRLMVERGLLAPGEATGTRVRDWLEAHPGEQRALLEDNPNYVFFRVLNDVPLAEGAPGTLGVPLTPLRSVAVGRDVPLGAPVFIDTDGLRRLMLAQDTSSGQTEIFFGWGAQAQAAASALHVVGHLFVLRPRPRRPAA